MGENQNREWDGRQVPPAVYEALTARLRGQKLGPKAMKVIDFFEEAAVLQVPEVYTRSTPSKLKVKEHVKTKLTLKADPSCSRTYAAGAINPTKLVDVVLKNPKVSDESKAELCKTGGSATSKAWLAEFEAKSKATQTAAARALEQAEHAVKSAAEKKADERQRTRDQTRIHVRREAGVLPPRERAGADLRSDVLRRQFLDRHLSDVVVRQGAQVQAASSSLQLRHPMVQHCALSLAAQTRRLRRRRRGSDGRGWSLALSEEGRLPCAGWPLF